MTPTSSTALEAPTPPAEPGLLGIATDGAMKGQTSTYEKYLGDLEGVYFDADAYAARVSSRGASTLAYRVEEHHDAKGPGALIVGTSTLLPGRVGDEFAVTRGHLHAKSDRDELYYCLAGRGVMLMETLDGQSRAVPLTPGQAAHVPGEWIHRSVNVGDEPFVTLICYAADAGQDYGLITEAQGMAQLVVTDGAGGWTTRANPRHLGYRRAEK